MRTWKSKHNYTGILYSKEGTNAKYNQPKTLQIKLNGIKNILACKDPANATHMDNPLSLKTNAEKVDRIIKFFEETHNMHQ
jgi:hypothetical protein